jgi:circadian clock protein KaiC
MHKAVNSFKPQVVVVDPLNSFTGGSNQIEVKSMLMRLVDFLKTGQVTGFFTILTSGSRSLEHTDIAISSLIDTWLLVRDIEISGERNRGLYILKSRGMAHSNQIREFLITDHGVELRDVYVGPAGVLTGSARLAQEAQDSAAQMVIGQKAKSRRIELERKSTVLEAQIAALRAELEAQQAESLVLVGQEQGREVQLTQDRVDMALSRKADRKPNRRAKNSK